jgi:hypothetical protein
VGADAAARGAASPADGHRPNGARRPGPAGSLAGMIVPLAHMGHVLIDTPLYGGPVILLALAWVVIRRMGGIQPRARSGPGDEQR